MFSPKWTYLLGKGFILLLMGGGALLSSLVALGQQDRESHPVEFLGCTWMFEKSYMLVEGDQQRPLWSKFGSAGISRIGKVPEQWDLEFHRSFATVTDVEIRENGEYRMISYKSALEEGDDLSQVIAVEHESGTLYFHNVDLAEFVTMAESCIGDLIAL